LTVNAGPSAINWARELVPVPSRRAPKWMSTIFASATFLNYLEIAAAALWERAKFGLTQKLSESCRHCKSNMLKSKRIQQTSGKLTLVGWLAAAQIIGKLGPTKEPNPSCSCIYRLFLNWL